MRASSELRRPLREATSPRSWSPRRLDCDSSLRRASIVQAELGDLGFEALEALGDGLEGELDLAALQAEGGELLAGGVGLGDEALGLALEAGEGGFGLGLFVAGLGGALHELHGGAAILLGLLLGVRRRRGRRPGRLPAGAGRRRGSRSDFGGGGLEEAAVLFLLAGEGGELARGPGEVVGAGGEAAGELGDAVGVGGGAGGDAFELDGGLVGAWRRLRGSVRRGCSRGARLRCARRPWPRRRRPARRSVAVSAAISACGGGLLGVELGEAAGEDDAQAAAELVAELRRSARPWRPGA